MLGQYRADDIDETCKVAARMPHHYGLYPPFRLDQLNKLSIWGVVRPAGLSVRIATDHEYYPEVAVLHLRESQSWRFLIHPWSQKGMVLIRFDGCKWELPTLEIALAKVVSFKRQGIQF